MLDIFKEFGTNLGSFLAPWLKRFDTGILIMGGNISHAWNLFGKETEEALRKEGCETITAISELKEDAALLGSACLLDEEFWKAVQPALALM